MYQAKEMEAFQWNACKSLFDSYQADTVPDAVKYMGNKFGFFVPVSNTRILPPQHP